MYSLGPFIKKSVHILTYNMYTYIILAYVSYQIDLNSFIIRLKCRDPRILLELFLVDFVAILNGILSNQLYFHLVMITCRYHASTRMVASKLNHQIILLLKRPLTHYWTAPLMTAVHVVVHVQYDMHQFKVCILSCDAQYEISLWNDCLIMWWSHIFHFANLSKIITFPPLTAQHAPLHIPHTLMTVYAPLLIYATYPSLHPRYPGIVSPRVQPYGDDWFIWNIPSICVMSLIIVIFFSISSYVFQFRIPSLILDCSIFVISHMYILVHVSLTA